MTDLYKVLGVPKDATKADIIAAYRRRAKTLHPDVGGSRVAFEELTLAKDTLSDPDLRARYDATGEIGVGGAISNDLAETATMLTMVFEAALQGIADEGSAARFDLLRSMRMVMEAETDNRSRRRIQLQAAKKRLAAIQKRLTIKKSKKPAPAFLLNHLAGKLAPLDAELAALERADATAKRASEMLEDYVYDYEKVVQQTVQLGTGSTMFWNVGPR